VIHSYKLQTYSQISDKVVMACQGHTLKFIGSHHYRRRIEVFISLITNVNVLKLYSSTLMKRPNKLACLSLGCLPCLVYYISGKARRVAPEKNSIVSRVRPYLQILD
jgi:hypothetical protein